jgi:S1-C subfamily serine protease
VGQLTSQGKVNRRLIGIQIAPLDSSLAIQLGISSEAIVIQSVEPGSLADAAGMRAGDIVTHIQGRRIQGITDLRTVIAHSGQGVPLSLRVLRNGSELDITIN